MTTPSATSSDAWLRSSTRKPASRSRVAASASVMPTTLGTSMRSVTGGGCSADARRNTRNTSKARSVSNPKAVRMKGIWDGPDRGGWASSGCLAPGRPDGS